MTKLYGLPAVESGVKVRVIPSPFDSAPAYVGLTGVILRSVGEWTNGDGELRTQYRVLMDETEENLLILRNPPVQEKWGPIWPPEGPYEFTMLDHELERLDD